MPNENDDSQQPESGKVNVWIRIPPELKPRLEALAAKSGLSLEKYVTKVIECAVKKMGKEIDGKPSEFMLDNNPIPDEDMELVREFLSSLSGNEDLDP